GSGGGAEAGEHPRTRTSTPTATRIPLAHEDENPAYARSDLNKGSAPSWCSRALTRNPAREDRAASRSPQNPIGEGRRHRVFRACRGKSGGTVCRGDAVRGGRR